MTLLTGKNGPNKYNLSGKDNKYISQIPYEINKLKVRILDLFILPLLSKQMSKIQENRFLIDFFKDKLDSYYKLYKLDDLLWYKDLLSAFDVFADQQVQLEENEKKMNAVNASKNEIITMQYRTAMIKLKPEYELYNSILGRPKRELKETYKEEIIVDIQKYMTLENITFQKMKEFITNKYLI